MNLHLDRNGHVIRAHVAHLIDGGEGHSYPSLCGWHCEVHNQVCSPLWPVSLDVVLKHAARDESLSDDAFAVLAPVLREAQS